MANKGLVIFDEDTGAIIKNPVIRLRKEFYENIKGLQIGATVKDSEVRICNIRIYSTLPKEEVAPLSHKEFGKFKTVIDKGRRFSKVYHIEDPDFTCNIYYKYWHKLCKHLDQDTNILLKSDGSRATFIADFISVCTGSKRSVYAFIRECKSKNLIAMIQVGADNHKYFILNPLFSLNGNKMPIILYNLFEAFSTDEGDVNNSKHDSLGVNQ